MRWECGEKKQDRTRMVLLAVACIHGGATADALPGLTSACSRLPPASAPASRPLPAAAEAQR
jgi:hypothetical protein